MLSAAASPLSTSTLLTLLIVTPVPEAAVKLPALGAVKVKTTAPAVAGKGLAKTKGVVPLRAWVMRCGRDKVKPVCAAPRSTGTPPCRV